MWFSWNDRQAFLTIFQLQDKSYVASEKYKEGKFILEVSIRRMSIQIVLTPIQRNLMDDVQ